MCADSSQKQPDSHPTYTHVTATGIKGMWAGTLTVALTPASGSPGRMVFEPFAKESRPEIGQLLSFLYELRPYVGFRMIA